MSAKLSAMLGKSEKEVSSFISEMEDKLCYPSHDVRLLSELTQAVKQKIASLGLDPNDTTGQELYHGLQAKFAQDVGLADRALGINTESGFEDRLSRAVEIAKHTIGDKDVWALKPTKARSLLLEAVPKKLMKQFGYRSLDSMLKRENIGELYLLAPYVESGSWQTSFAKAISKVGSNDYTMQAINYVQPSVGKWESLPTPSDLNICNKQTGSLTIWPTKSLSSAPVISLSLLLLRSVQELGVKVDTKVLATTHPALHFWSNQNHLISLHDDGPVSLNIHDVTHNHLNSLAHQDSSSKYGASALWDELSSRYQAATEDIGQVLEDEISNLVPAEFAAAYEKA